MAEHALKAMAEESESRRESRIDDIAEAAVPVIFAGCLRSSEEATTLEAIAARVRAGLERRHPGTLRDEGCDATIAELRQALTPEALAKVRRQSIFAQGTHAWLAVSGLHRLQQRRCLVP